MSAPDRQSFLKSENFFRESYKQKDSFRGDTAVCGKNFQYFENDIFRYKYNGQEKDEGTGLLYYKARYYDPELQHFISADSIVPDITRTQCFNPYMYCTGNPIGFIDYDGHSGTYNQTESTVEGIVGGGGGTEGGNGGTGGSGSDDKSTSGGNDGGNNQDSGDGTDTGNQDTPASDPNANDPRKDAGHGSDGSMYPTVAGNMSPNVMGMNPNPQQNGNNNSREREMVLGALQMVGGASEAYLGGEIALGGAVVTAGSVGSLSWAGVPAMAGGAYLFADGLSNLAGGASRFKNAWNKSGKGETWNFIKNAMMAVSPENGKNVYNATQLVTGMVCIGAGASGLMAGKAGVSTTAQGSYLVSKGAETFTRVESMGLNFTFNTWTSGGMLVRSVNIDAGGIAGGSFLLGVDCYNYMQ